MLSAEQRTAIRDRVRALVASCSGDHMAVTKLVNQEYYDTPAYLDYAAFVLNDGAQSPKADSESSPGIGWTRINRDDEIGRFVQLEELRTGRHNARYCKAKSAYAEITMFVKFIRQTQLVNDMVRRGQILAEFRILKNFTHPNVVQVFDAGWARFDDGTECPYVATEFLLGVTLNEWRKDHIPKPREAAEAVRVLAAALEAIRQQGRPKVISTFGASQQGELLHLDLKPENVMVTYIKDGVVGPADATTLKIIDFGSAGTAETAPARGDSRYSAPERYSNSDQIPTPQSTWDIFSLGGMLFYLCTGQDPKSAEQVTEGDWKRWLETVELGDVALTLVCRKAMAFESAARYQSVKELFEDLHALISDFPLPHLGLNSNRWNRERLLLKRSREKDNLDDHSQVIGRAALVLTPVIAAMMIAHIGMYWGGKAPEVAFIRAGMVANLLCLGLFVGCAWLVRFNTAALRMFEPLWALIISFVIILHILMPTRIGHFPTWDETVRGAQFVVLLLAVLNIALSASTPHWRFLRWVGWGQLLLAVFIRPILEVPQISPYMPVILGAAEISGCVAFAAFTLGKAPRSAITPT
jgi:serine/threonine protein kinase